ncbi:hypothetical protein BFJ63_vAg16654 [Fusarium oxysporum f. sp. narcissi]|uniref:Uncharacterized protein n=1 Tax=Fusarium oxysporum f. sp. narcissi TaxID=451672 RepID=A0A4Q2V1M5_FUSOX|nr:hypothetical protein BFJ63_vAg16654 [Fusarium oxysporum f. sp. narcissi]
MYDTWYGARIRSPHDRDGVQHLSSGAETTDGKYGAAEDEPVAVGGLGGRPDLKSESQTVSRNRARTSRRAGRALSDLEGSATAAAKQYHDTTRQRKMSHWKEFLADHDNTWKAASYIKSGDDAAFGKVPQLTRADGIKTTNHREQAEELRAKLFPPLPDTIEDQGLRQRRASILIPKLTWEEMDRQLWGTKLKSASRRRAASDHLEAGVAVGEHDVLDNFQASLEDGIILKQ